MAGHPLPARDTNLNRKTVPEITPYLASFCQPGVTPVIENADPPHHADQHRPEIRNARYSATSGRLRIRQRGRAGEWRGRYGMSLSSCLAGYTGACHVRAGWRPAVTVLP